MRNAIIFSDSHKFAENSRAVATLLENSGEKGPEAYASGPFMGWASMHHHTKSLW